MTIYGQYRNDGWYSATDRSGPWASEANANAVVSRADQVNTTVVWLKPITGDVPNQSIPYESPHRYGYTREIQLFGVELSEDNRSYKTLSWA